MRSDLRVVFDTNTLISAFLIPKSIPRQALDTATAAGRLLLSTATAAELTELLRQPRFDRYLAEHRRMTLVAVVIHNADLVEVDVTITTCRDPKGNKFLELAVSGQATHLVTGDQDLLILHPYRHTTILTPRQFLAEIASPS
ncbi:MAG: putative toxin-antitoxin system toxin component, PIN family [Candidatus Methylomirabilales bacterium]